MKAALAAALADSVAVATAAIELAAIGLIVSSGISSSTWFSYGHRLGAHGYRVYCIGPGASASIGSKGWKPCASPPPRGRLKRRSDALDATGTSWRPDALDASGSLSRRSDALDETGSLTSRRPDAAAGTGRRADAREASGTSCDALEASGTSRRPVRSNAARCQLGGAPKHHCSCQTLAKPPRVARAFEGQP